MKYAILSDIHANPIAFETVLKDAKDQDVDQVICLGDITGYGYDVVTSYELAKNNCDELLLGNHETACVGIEPEIFTRENPNYDFDIKQRRELGQDRLAEIRKLPYTFSNQFFSCTHGSFLLPEMFNYILTLEDAQINFAITDKKLMFIGHTHQAKVWILNPDGTIVIKGLGAFGMVDGCRYIVNVGSVGYPRNDSFSSYAVFDSSTGVIDLRRLDFDITSYIKSFAERELQPPQWINTRKKFHRKLSVKRN